MYFVKAVKDSGYARQFLKSDNDNFFTEDDVKNAMLKDRDVKRKNRKVAKNRF